MRKDRVRPRNSRNPRLDRGGAAGQVLKVVRRWQRSGSVSPAVQSGDRQDQAASARTTRVQVAPHNCAISAGGIFPCLPKQ